jgi:hypothetical protein
MPCLLVLNTSDEAAKYLGITSNLVCALSAQAQDFPDLLGLKTAFLYSSALSDNKYISSNKGSEDIIAEVPIKSQFGFLNIYESNASDDIDLILYRHKRVINTIDIQLRDEDGEILDLGKQAEVFIVLKMFYNTDG